MRPARVLYPVAGLLFVAAAISPLLAQLAAPSSTSSVSTVAPASSTPTPSPGGLTTTSSRLPTRTLRMVLPDPALLDGAKLAPDKYPEYGMIGDFEMPGDDVTDPAQNQRVGVSKPNQTEPTAGGNAKMDPNQKGGGGDASQPKADQAGGGGDAQSKSGASGGAEQAKSDKSGSGSSGSSGGGSNTAGGTKAGGKSPGRNDPNAKAEGVQVGELKIDDSVANSPEINASGVPVEIGIGDSTMAIKPVAAPATTTAGAQSAGNTQQSNKTGGPAQGGAGGSSGNRGAERGKTMPSGL